MHKLSDTVEKKFIESLNASDWEVETADGFVDIISTNKTIEYRVYRVILENGLYIDCADTHILIDSNGEEVFAIDAMNRTIKTKFGESVVVDVVDMCYYEHMYDLSVDSKEHTYYTNDILSHNTTTSAAYIVWYTLFQANKNVAILANKATAAREVLNRYQTMYESLPKWLQQGVTTWNKGDIELENGSKVFTAATSASGIRGKSCVTGDTRVCIEQNDDFFYVEIDHLINDKMPYKEDVNMNEKKLYTVYKTVNLLNQKEYIGYHSTSEDGILRTEFGRGSCFADGHLGSGELIKLALVKYGPNNFCQQILFVSSEKEKAESYERSLVNEEYKTFTPNTQPERWWKQGNPKKMKILSSDGFKCFSGFVNQGRSDTLYFIQFSSGESIKVTGDHRFLTEDKEWVEAKSLLPLDGLFGGEVIEHIELVENELVYDAYDVEEVHNYYTNGVISHNCNMLYIDEAAIIPNTVAEQFFTSVYPTVSAGQTTKILLSSTPLGYNHFWKYWNDAQENRNGFVPLFIPYWEIPGRDAAWAEEQRRQLGELKYNQEILCQFLGSSLTLVNADTISKLSYASPIKSINGLDVYDAPIRKGEQQDRDHSYVIVADTAEGVGGDYSAFVVIDITQAPYKVVAKYRSNTISPLLYPNAIYKVAKEYNEAYVLIEINKGEQVASILHQDLEYENIIFVNRSTKGQIVSGGFGGGTSHLGVFTDKKVKRIGCMMFKSLVEECKLLIPDADIISEITTFIESKGTYKADDGYHDDLVMPLVLFSWLTTSPYFKDLNDVNLRNLMYSSKIELIENELTPFGFYTDGSSSEETPLYNF